MWWSWSSPLAAMRGGLTAEEYRWKLIRQYLKK
jgi:hypothetical protein